MTISARWLIFSYPTLTQPVKALQSTGKSKTYFTWHYAFVKNSFLIFTCTTVEQHKRATQRVCPFSVSYPMCGKAHLYVAYFLALCSAVRCLIFSYSESIFLRCQRRSPANSSKGATYSAAERKSPSTS